MKTVSRDPAVIELTLYRNGLMNARMKNWMPVSVHILADPDARAFAEAVRQLVLKMMRASRGIDIPI